MSEYAIETWRADNGLPQNNATDVIQTRRGYIWVGTYNGIAQFDGIRFQVFDSSNTKGLANSRVTQLHEDSRGDVWIGHDNGEVSGVSVAGFRSFTLPTNWEKAPIKGFAEDEHGDVWAFNQLGAALRVRDGFIAQPPPLLGEDPFLNLSVVRDNSGQLFIVRNGAVAHFSANIYAPIDFGDLSTRPYYAGIAAARDGGLWVAGEGRLRKWSGTNWIADLGEPPWGDASLTVMREVSSGRLFVGTLRNGLYVFDAATGWFNLNRRNGLPQDGVGCLVEDREKNIWVGTGGGLALLRNRKVLMQSPPDDWQGRPVQSITRAADGTIWAATEGAGVYRFQSNRWTHFDVANPFVWSVLADSRGDVWAGTWGGGLFRLIDNEFIVQTNLVPLSDPVTALYESPDGTMWIGTGAGLARLHNGKFESLARFGGAAAGDVRVIAAGVNGELWIGTQGSGLGRWHNNEFKTFRISDGLPGNFVLSLYAESDSTLWIGMLDMGICRYHNGEFRAITTAQGLPANIIYSLREDDLGNLWCNSPAGLFRVSKQELNDCADGKATRLNVLAYGMAEGLSTLAGTGGFTPSGFRTPEGQLCFSTARGIAMVSPQAAQPNLVRPPVWIEEILVDTHAAEPSTNVTVKPISSAPAAQRQIELAPGRRQLEISFTGLSFTSPERVQFRYRLEGHGVDEAWTEAGSRRRVNYSFLPPGNYTFRVTACNSDGLWNESGDALAIRVLPYFWQTLWFKTALAISSCALVGGLVYAVSRRRHRRKLENIARERALERERSRIAQDIHDEVGASLTRIGLLSESTAGDLENLQRAAMNLDQIITTTRELTRSMDEIVWAVNPRHDTLESLTNYISRFAQDFLSTANIRCRLAMPLQLPDISVRSEVRHNLFLACKEALNNVVKHSRANEVRLTLELLPDGLRFIVADNGTGFSNREIDKASRRADHRPAAGNGLPNMQRRLQRIGGRSRLHSEPGVGTSVDFFVPLTGAATSQ